MFVGRVLNLLRGLASSLGARHSYLCSMTPFAHEALAAAPAPALPATGRREHSALEALIVARLEALAAEGRVMGMQVCVLQHGRALVDLCFGRTSPYSNTPVESNTLFNVFSVSKALCAALVHLFVQRGALCYSDPIAQHWPEFGRHGKHSITVAQALAHQCGLQHAGTPQLRDAPFRIAEWVPMLAAMEEAVPAAESAYHYLSFGWILGGLLERISGRPFGSLVREELALPLGVGDELFVGVPPQLLEGSESSTAAGAAVVGVGQGEAGRLAVLSSHVDQASMQTMASRSGAAEEQMLMLLSPSVFNHNKFRASCIPAANGHCSARALAAFYASLLPCTAEDGEQAAPQLFGEGSAAVMRDGEPEGGVAVAHCSMGYGFQRYSLGDSSTAFGHGGVGGSLGFADPGSGLAVAITLNRLNAGCEPTQAVLEEICEGLGLGKLQGYTNSAATGGDGDHVL